MPTNTRLIRIFVVLGILCATIYLGQFFWRMGQKFSHLLILVAVAWLIAYILSPIARWLSSGHLPQKAIAWLERKLGTKTGAVLARLHIPYALAAVILYLLVLGVLALGIVLAAPVLVDQMVQLAGQVPTYLHNWPVYWQSLEAFVGRFGVSSEMLSEATTQLQKSLSQLTSAMPKVIGNVVIVVQAVAAGVTDTLLVLILSLYIMLDGKRLWAQLLRVVPNRYQDELEFIASIIDRTFGGFLRGQVVMALAQSLFTWLLMTIFGLHFSLVTALASGLVMFIPELGAPLAMLAPSAVAIIQGSPYALLVLIIMFIFQQILLRIIMPRLLSEAIGMPPLLVLLSVLAGTMIMGLWGFFFGIPVAGAIYTVAIFVLEKYKQHSDAEEKGLDTTDGTQALDQPS